MSEKLKGSSFLRTNSLNCHKNSPVVFLILFLLSKSLVSSLFFDLNGWVDPNVGVLLEQALGSVLCCLNESVKKDLIVRIVV